MRLNTLALFLLAAFLGFPASAALTVYGPDGRPIGTTTSGTTLNSQQLESVNSVFEVLAGDGLALTPVSTNTSGGVTTISGAISLTGASSIFTNGTFSGNGISGAITRSGKTFTITLTNLAPVTAANSNILANAITNTATGVTLGGTFTGTHSGSGAALTGVIAAGVSIVLSPTNMPPSVVTNRGTANLSQTEVSNASLGGNLTFNKASQLSTDSSLDSYQGRLALAAASGSDTIFLNSGRATGNDFWGNTSYGGLSFGSSSKLIPYATQWQYLQSAYDWGHLVAATMFSPMYAGSGAGLDDLPPHANVIRASQPKPFISLVTYSFGQFIFKESHVTAQLLNNQTNGLLNAITNAGLDLYLHLDAAARFLTNNRVGGQLKINTANFPSGTNYIPTWNAVGYKFALTVYGWPSPAAEVRVGPNGDTYPGGGGWAENDFVPAMTPNTIRTDVRTLYDWRVRAFRFSDVTDGQGYFNTFSRGLASAVLTPTQSGSTYAAAWNDTANNSLPYQMAIFSGAANVGQVSPNFYNECNWVWYDVAGTYPGEIVPAPTSQIQIDMNLFRSVATNVIPYTEAAWPVGITYASDYTLAQCRHRLAIAALENGINQIMLATNSTLSANMPVLLSQVTNTEYLKIYGDVASKVVTYADTGASNQSGWYKKMENGDVVVGLFNESTTLATNLTVSLAAYPFNSLKSYRVLDVFEKTNAPSVNGSFTINLPAETCRLLRFSETVPTMSGNMVLATNIVSTNLTASAFQCVITNYGIYEIIAKVNVKGFGSGDYISAYVVSTNAVSGGLVLYSDSVLGSFAVGGAVYYNSQNDVTLPFAITATGDGYGTLGRGYNSYSMVQAGTELKMLVQITNPPVTFFCKGLVEADKTHTNTVYAGSYWKVTKIQ